MTAHLAEIRAESPALLALKEMPADWPARFAVFAFHIDGLSVLNEDDRLTCRDAATWAWRHVEDVQREAARLSEECERLRGERDGFVEAWDDWYCRRGSDSLMDTKAQAFERLLRAIAKLRAGETPSANPPDVLYDKFGAPLGDPT